MSSGTVARAIFLLAAFVLLSGQASVQQSDPAEAERIAFELARKRDPSALTWLERAAKAGRPAAQGTLGRLYYEGVGVPKDRARALELIRASAEAGSSIGQQHLAASYMDAGDRAQAFYWYSAAARQEDAYSIGALSWFYGQGQVVAKDETRAKRLLLRAAELGDGQARRQAWRLLLWGPAEDRDSRLGMHFLSRAANANDASAVYLLAREYLQGRDVPRNPQRAAQLLTRNSEAKHTLSSLWLSLLHFKGYGVAQDAKRGELLLEAALGNATLRQRNDFAWSIVVNRDAQLRDGALAVRVLEAALAAEKEKSAAHLDTLAAVYAEIQQFEKAAGTQLSAIQTLRRSQASQADLPAMEQRLEMYRHGEAYREDTL